MGFHRVGDYYSYLTTAAETAGLRQTHLCRREHFGGHDAKREGEEVILRDGGVFRGLRPIILPEEAKRVNMARCRA